MYIYDLYKYAFFFKIHTSKLFKYLINSNEPQEMQILYLNTSNRSNLQWIITS